jgi:hypothetical protein
MRKTLTDSSLHHFPVFLSSASKLNKEVEMFSYMTELVATDFENTVIDGLNLDIVDIICINYLEFLL